MANTLDKQRPKSVVELTASRDSRVAYLLDNLARIRQLNQSVQARLPLNLKNQCHVINFRDNRIIIGAHSSSWATRLKFFVPELLSALRAEGYSSLRGIDIIISPHSI